ncbi:MULTISPECIES: rubredoxin [Gammaproteobacteria]|jgi:rubredoxin|uniref:Rubredoxin n=6 Tax=Gammaproteobacteria TaxID=1236 RepID=A0A1M2USB1_MARNT|nr:Rubredoxin-type Fe(Cys)4 protein [Marinobacter nauticus VT8]AZR43074.1 alkane 1-monooxygenase [Marinobacter salarius]ERS06797.1 rubredoxin [Marinobacter sp. EN3]KAE8545825.1 Rubredoxin 1 [Marinobacter nauticus]MAB50653.1 rubredoxin [Marinobacter sp.]MCD1629507.1 rubredoxin [Marinobacter shengliensis]RBP26492.1 rubredoxin [Marinobacter pelagius]SFE96385.1 Rubredoxin [Marinobacter sp. DSM 26671]|tara:strand:- start:256 stop:774 length:519 start_codon:yes stop_codon:yes gene_type:complete
MAKHQCPDCGYVYDEVVGDPHEGFPAGTTWEKIPEDWSCPDCAVRDKVDFVALQEANSELSVSATNIAVRTASQAKTEGASQKATDASTPSAKNKTKPKAKPKPTSSKSPKDSTQKDTYRKWVCITCGHIYDEALGDEAEGFPAGTRFEDIPDDWCCPDCGATKEDYVLYED